MLDIDIAPISMRSAQKHQGFTIVELLIVIVVIAILASIIIISYTGIQNRAHNSIVESDLATFAKKIQLSAADSGGTPEGGMKKANSSAPASGDVRIGPANVTLVVSPASYYQTDATSGGAANFIYCTGTDPTSGRPSYAVAATSRDGTLYRYSSTNPTATIIGRNASTPGTHHACGDFDYPRTYSYGFFVNSGGWQTWTRP